VICIFGDEKRWTRFVQILFHVREILFIELRLYVIVRQFQFQFDEFSFIPRCIGGSVFGCHWDERRGEKASGGEEVAKKCHGEWKQTREDFVA
jgi:hypothetical protein